MLHRGNNHSAGFTLIELMIVISVIAIVASLAVPNLLAGKVSSNENVTVGTLRSIATAQFQFKAASFVDRDNSGSFEYGTLAELSGVAVVRHYDQRLAPALLSNSMGQVDPVTGYLTRQGYHYAMYLPDAAGVGQPETAAGLATVDPHNAEFAYTILAWPISNGGTGRKTYFLNQQGEVLKSMTASYSGVTQIPPPGAGLVGGAPGTIIGARLAVGTVGADGNTWLPIR